MKISGKPVRLRSLLRYWYRDCLRGSMQRWRWRRAGIDVSMVSVQDLGLDLDYAKGYACSGGPHLAKVLTDLGVGPQDSIINLGCGKGGALITMASFPFRRVVGLELSPELVKIAGQNMRLAGCERCELIQGDARELHDYDDFTHIYMYNPFPSSVMRVVVERVEESVKRIPRDLTIIYKTASCHDDIVRNGVFSLVRRFDPAGHPFLVYRPAAPAPASSQGM
jgi:16S rRNA G966 N2-methylase RsmD